MTGDITKETKGIEMFFATKTAAALSSSTDDPDFIGLLDKDDIYEDRIGCRVK